MNVLIIGSKGFIGSHLLTYYRSQPHIAVYGADVVVDYREENYFQVSADNSDFKALFLEKQFSLCVNCSGAASVPDSLENPARDFALNTHNVQKILEAIRRITPKCRFINLSSAAVYGNPESLPICEDQSLQPVSPYGYHKLYAEQLCEEYYRFFGIATCSIRIFSAYGEGLYKQLFYDLYQKASSGEEVNLFGTGKESRDFIHVTDIVRVIDLVSEKGDFAGDTVNVANGQEEYIDTVVNLFYSNFTKQVDYVFSGQGRKGDPSNWVADISVIKKLGYAPSIGLEQGLARYYQWISQEG
jgi:UDP-glucose 4-epimerase